MRVGRFPRALGLVGALPLLSLAAAAQEVDLPSYNILPCEAKCTKGTEPIPLGDHKGYFPSSELHASPLFQSDAFVLIRFTITAAGTVENPVVEKLVGPPDFAEKSLEAVKNWRYAPATADGVPVAVHNWHAQLTYRFSDGDTGVRESIYDTYNKALSLIAARKFHDAADILKKALGLDRLNFYERSALSYLLAVSNFNLKNYLTARENVEDATLMGGRYAARNIFVAAMRLRIDLDAITGQFADALDSYAWLQKGEPNLDDDSLARLIQKIRKRLGDPRPIVIRGRIPKSQYASVWTHTLLRRTFAFPTYAPAVTRFVLRCDQQSIASSLSAEAEWHVPKDWSHCDLEVSGAPGSEFELMESND